MGRRDDYRFRRVTRSLVIDAYVWRQRFGRWRCEIYLKDRVTGRNRIYHTDHWTKLGAQIEIQSTLTDWSRSGDA